MKPTPKLTTVRPGSKGEVPAVGIRRLRGFLKREPGEKSFTEEWVEHKRQEMQLEAAKESAYKSDHCT